ncbi:MAG: 2-oxo-4-hydroxy-4-carboxy-5-ureidoimidazoline decarboxylase [Vicinamibacteria bacterium]|nr:2-oxo-4-hydroxy-4-carboxy-5-ureidoimidazoline decarboxylase [Vicinamibacteria bacterium]
MDGPDWLDAASSSEATAALFRCCGVAGWANRMAALRPFGTSDALMAAAESEWRRASRDEILEAFLQHPRIGDRESLRARFPLTHAWSAHEQGGASGAEEKVLDDLAEGNRLYEARFGHMFIVCASGKAASEMLALLRARLDNDPIDELRVAAAEQMKITRLRIERLLRERAA